MCHILLLCTKRWVGKEKRKTHLDLASPFILPTLKSRKFNTPAMLTKYLLLPEGVPLEACALGLQNLAVEEKEILPEP